MVFQFSQTVLLNHAYSSCLCCWSFFKCAYQSIATNIVISSNITVPHIRSLMPTKAKLIPACCSRARIWRQPLQPLHSCQKHSAQQDNTDDKHELDNNGPPTSVPHIFLQWLLLNKSSGNRFLFFLQSSQFRLWPYMFKLPCLIHTHENSCRIWNC